MRSSSSFLRSARRRRTASLSTVSASLEFRRTPTCTGRATASGSCGRRPPRRLSSGLWRRSPRNTGSSSMNSSFGSGRTFAGRSGRSVRGALSQSSVASTRGRSGERRLEGPCVDRRFIAPDAVPCPMIEPDERTKIYSTLDTRFEDFVTILSDYLRVPTISAHGAKFQEGAEATKKVLEAIGADVRLVPEEGGPPVVIDGFLDGVPPPDPGMLRYLRRNTADPIAYKEDYGAREIYGGKTRYARIKQATYGTTCTIDGIWSGYTGAGHKTVNPAVAHAKLDFRLLPGQRPDAIFDLLVAHLRTKGFSDVKVEKHSVFEPAASAISERLPQAILAATREVYGTEPNVFPWSYGSSTTWYFTRMGTPAPHPPGVGYQGSRAHAPNEQIRLDDARRAMKVAAGMLMALSTRDTSSCGE